MSFPTQGPFTLPSSPAPSQPGSPCPGGTYCAFAGGFPIPHVASSVSTAESEFKYDKILGSSSCACRGVALQWPQPSLVGYHVATVTELRQVTMVRQVTEVTWKLSWVRQVVKLTRCYFVFKSVIGHLLSTKPQTLY